MGNTCCSYLIRRDNNPFISDPISILEVNKVCEDQLHEEQKSEKTQKKKFISSVRKDEPTVKATSPDKKISNYPNPDSLQEKIALPSSRSLENNFVSPFAPNPVVKTNEINLEIPRVAQRSLSTLNDIKKNEFDPKKSINLDELKLPEELSSKIEKIGMMKNNNNNKALLRSMTQGHGETSIFEDEPEGTNTRKDRIKNELIENKKELERMSSNVHEGSKTIKSKSSDQKEKTKIIQENESMATLPKKGLLKKYKTIGTDKKEKSKKKVKFKELFDAKGNKKKSKGRMKLK